MMSSESDNNDEDDANSQYDEVQQIKIAMREAKARKKTLSKKLRQHTDRSNADKSELENILKLRTDELAQCKRLLGECELQLREAHYEIKQLQSRTEKKVEEGKEEAKYFKETINELRSALSATETVSTTKNKVILSECEKLSNLVASLLRSSLHGINQLSPRTSQQILQRISSDINRLKDYLSSAGIDFPAPSSSSAALRSSLSSLLSRSAATDQHDQELHSPAHTFDSTLLDMCRNLEEENVQLAGTVNELRLKLQESERESSVNKLIPHYRLAIIRSKAYASNLQEQLKREKESSQQLREQLETAYADLKQVVEEKRRLYTSVQKRELQQDERKQALYADNVAADAKVSDYLPVEEFVNDHDAVKKVEQIRRPPSHRGFRYSSVASNASADRSSVDSRPGDIPEQLRTSHSIRSSSATDHWRRSQYQPKQRQQQLGERDEYEYEYEEGDDDGDEEKEEEDSSSDPRTHSLRASKESQKVAHQLKDELTTLDVEIEELKEKLAAAARSESQSILKAVLEAKFSTGKRKS